MEDRKIAEAYAEWVKQVEWRLFCTFTFAWRVSDPQANKIFGNFVERLEACLKCDVGCLRGDEKRFSGCGKPACARHFHVLLACTAPVSPEFVEELWMSMAGKRSDGAGALVKEYDPNLNGAAYALKFIDQPDGDWDLKKLHLFHPSVSQQNSNTRMRRRLRRHPALAELMARQASKGQSC
jgi:hypothetical protein